MQRLYISCANLLKINWFFLFLLLFSGMAQAVNYTFSGSSFPACSNGVWSQSGSTWTCNGSFTLNSGDTINPGSSLTIDATGGMTFNGSNTVGSSSNTVNLQTSSGNVVISGTSTIYGSVSGSSNFTLSSTAVTGAISTSGSINLSGGNISGIVSGSNGVTSTGGTVFGGSITSTNGSVIVSGGSVAGNVNGNGVSSTNSTVFGGTISSPNNSISLSGGSVAGNISGNGVTTTNTNLSNGVTSNNSSLSISGGTISGTITGNGITISSVTMTSGNITASNNTISISNSKIGSASFSVTISNNNIVNISSGTTVYGNVTAGSWSSALSIDSTSKVYGVCTSNSNSTSSPASYPSCSAIVVVAEYRMDELSWNGTAGEIVDSTGNGNNAVAVNGATTTTGKLCNAGSFNGTNQNLLLPNTSDLNFGSGIGFTITTWIKTTDAYGGIVSLRNTGDGGQVVIDLSLGYNGAITAGGGQFVPILRDNSGNIGYFSSGPVVNNGAWHFLAITFNPATSKFTSFVDGTSVGSVSLSSTAGFTSYGVRTVGKEGYWGAGSWDNNTAFTSTDNIFFSGQIDELKLFNSALSVTTISTIYSNENAGKNWDGTTRVCNSTPIPDHYEISLPTSSLSCLPTTVTVTACADTSSPCSNPFASAIGKTATLSTSVGTLGSSTITFGSTGTASTTISYPSASNAVAVAVSLANEQLSPANSSKCCPNGANCSVANSCSTTFNTAGFLLSSSAGGSAVAIPTQTAGTASSTYYLRAVQTNTTTMACQAALVGTQTINIGYQCNNPATCYTSNLMSVNGGTATTVARNNNGNLSSSTGVNLTFDSNGNAPVTLLYSDVGQVTLFATATVNSSTLLGVSNAFVAKPGGFVLSGIKQTASPNLVNPVATNATGAKFVKAGEAFSVTVTATTSSGTTTPSFGNETSPESVTLTPTMATGLGLSNNPNISGTFGSFNNGVATGTAFSWNEVGIITLTPSLLSANYMGVAGNVTGTTTGNIGRFYPAQFAVSGGLISNRTDIAACAIAGCGAFSYMGEQMTAGFTLTAKANDGVTTTQNYTTANGFAKLPLSNSGNPLGLGAIDSIAHTPLTVDYTTYGTASGSFSSGNATISAPFAIARGSSTVGPYNAVNIGIAPMDSDSVTMGTLNLDTNNDGTNDHALIGTTALRYGRLKISNAVGSQFLMMPISMAAQYWNGSDYVTSLGDNNTILLTSNLVLSSYTFHLSDSWTTTPALSNGTANNGIFSATLSSPNGIITGRGSVILTTNGPTYLPSTSALATFGVYRGNRHVMFMHENY